MSLNPGPLVRGSPSFWYFACPIARSRLASVSAKQWSHPGEICVQPVTGFQLAPSLSIVGETPEKEEFVRVEKELGP